MRWKWADGRQAIALETYSDLKPLTATIRITKNTCNQITEVRCYLKSIVRQRIIGIYWEKFPRDRKKVGTLIKRTRPFDNENNIVGQNYLSSYAVTALSNMAYQTRGFTSVAPYGLEDLLVCDNFSWLPKDQQTQTYFIDSWITQFETTNQELALGGSSITSPQTNLYETVAHGVELGQKSENELQIKAVRASRALADFGIFSLMAPAYSAVINFDRERVGVAPQASQGRVEWSDPQCRIEYAYNFGEVFAQLNSILVRDVTPPAKNAKPLLFDNRDPIFYGVTTNLLSDSINE